MLKVLAAVLAVLSAVISITIYTSTLPAVQKQAADNAAAVETLGDSVSDNAEAIETINNAIENINTGKSYIRTVAQTKYDLFSNGADVITIYATKTGDNYIDFYDTGNHKVSDLTYNLSQADTLYIYHVNVNGNNYYEFIKLHNGSNASTKYWERANGSTDPSPLKSIYSANGDLIVIY